MELAHDDQIELAQGTAALAKEQRHWGKVVRQLRCMAQWMIEQFDTGERIRNNKLRGDHLALTKRMSMHVLGIYEKTGIIFYQNSWELDKFCADVTPEARTKAEHKDTHESMYYGYT